MVRSGSSYASHSDLALTFGLGTDPAAAIRVEWPSGTVDVVRDVKARQAVIVEEGRGLIAPEAAQPGKPGGSE
jgi:hypothetical protein